MVSHVKLQDYQHRYCLVCLTGSLGCRWHRYKQSTRDSRKRDLLIFFLLTLTFLFGVFMLYTIAIMKNDFNDLNWFFYPQSNKWLPVYTIFLTIICVVFIYLFILMCLSLCHFLQGQQLYTHKVHTVFILLFLAFFIAMVITTEEMWKEEWALVWLSLKIFGPYLQVGGVAVMTLLSWMIARQWFTLSSTCGQLLWLILYLAMMTGLYISPLFINSPCVVLISDLPPKPRLLAHRGASAIAPENTLASFQVANEYKVAGFESDVRISLDGVPFICHDSTFQRTTNIDQVFPDLVKQDVSYFNISQIKELNAGIWFIKTDLMSTINEVSEEKKVLYRNQSIPTLLELVQYSNSTNTTLMFDRRGPPDDHPFKEKRDNLIVEAIQQGGMRPENILWLTDEQGGAPAGFTPVAKDHYYPSSLLHRNNISRVNTKFSVLSSDNIQEYKTNNISVNIFLVNERWLFSLYWCMGVPSVTTDNCHTLSSLQTPIFHLSPRNYLILWMTVDIMSALLVITAFIVQRILWSGSEYSPERIAINSASTNGESTNKTSRSSHRQSRRQMKEKLILRDVAADILDEDPESPEDFGIESNYTVQSTDGQEMVRTFQRTSGYERKVDAEINRVV